MDYKSRAQDPHTREQEEQWARIVAAGRPVEGMILIFVQKLCAAFHEFEPAWERGALNAGHLEYVRGRLEARITRVLNAIADHDMGDLPGAQALHGLLGKVAAAPTMDALMALAEEMHTTSHMLYDGLERRVLR